MVVKADKKHQKKQHNIIYHAQIIFYTHKSGRKPPKIKKNKKCYKKVLTRQSGCYITLDMDGGAVSLIKRRKKMIKFKQKTFKKVSDWIAAGHIASGYSLIENIKKETEKAIAVEIDKFNAAANLYTATVWLPKSLVQTVVNDYYLENMGATVYIAPDWLMKKKGAF